MINASLARGGNPETPSSRRGRGCERFARLSLAVAQGVVIALVTVAPWLFGAIQPTVQAWLAVALAAALLACLLAVVLGRSPQPLPLALLPVLGAIGLGGLQLVPWPESVASVLSPRAVALRGEMESAAPSTDASLAARFALPAKPDLQPISLYPASTRRDLVLLLLAAGVFLLGAVCFQQRVAVRWLLVFAAANGAAVTLFALVQRLSWNERLYWTVPLTMGGTPFGPYVNRNHAGGFLNIALACALGACVWVLGRDAGQERAATQSRLRPGDGLAARLRWRGLAFLAHLDGRKVLVLFLAAWLAAGVFCSLSRGAMVAMLAAAACTLLAVWLARRRPHGLAIGLGVAVIGLALLAWCGQTAAVRERLATLVRGPSDSYARIHVWRDAIRAVPDFWRTGSGLGTFRFLHGVYQSRPANVWYVHAENHYLEALVETGIPGLALLLAAMVAVGAAAWRLIRTGSDLEAIALGVAVVFALSSQALQSMVDFGLYLPANLLLAAVLCGAATGWATRQPASACASRGPRLVGSRGLTPGLLVLLVLGTAWAWREAQAEAGIDRAVRASRFADQPRAASPQEVHEAIQALSTALLRRQDHAEAHQHLGRLWICLYRLGAFEAAAGRDLAKDKREQAWQATLPIALHGRMVRGEDDGQAAGAETLRSDPLVRDNLLPALGHLVRARRACPLLPYVHLAIAELAPLVPESGEDLVSAERARLLAPANAEVWYEAGLVDLNAGRREAACRSWRGSLALSPKYKDNIFEQAHDRLSLLETVESVLPDSPALLIDFARRNDFTGRHYADLRRRLAQRAMAALDQGSWPKDEACYLRGLALWLCDRMPEAIDSVELAVGLRPREPAWSDTLAMLRKEQRLAEARPEPGRP